MAATIDLTKLTADELLYIRAKSTYYIGEPIMEDSEFDILEDHLRELDSFVVDIVGVIKIKGNKATISKGKNAVAKHITSMASLAKIQFKSNYVPYNEFYSWLMQIPKDTEAIIEFGPKLDGNAISLQYEDGKLVHVLSRGDGEEGQDYIKSLGQNVPQFIKGFTGEIRGEAVIDTYIFDTEYGINSNSSKKYANARNFVAGALNKGDINLTKDIDFVAFQIVDYTGNTIQQLIKWGFNTLDFVKTYEASQLTLQVFEKIYTEFRVYRESCKYQLDGIVAKMPEEIREEIGGNSHHPFWALAIKFETPAVYTKIVGIEWNLGKRGQLAPVAILEPVDLLGSVVTKASVYNADWMLKNKCYPGATVSLIKSGDIIPKIIEITEPSVELFELPTEWNNHGVTFDGVQLMLNDFEDTDAFKSLKLANSIVALGIEGIGLPNATKIHNSGIDLVKLLSETPEGLRMYLTNSGEYKDGRELEKIIESIYALTKVELWQVIYAMGYRNCGKTISKQLANWMCGIKYDFKGLEKSVVENFINDIDQQDEVKTLIQILIQNNVEVIKPVQIAADIITYEMTGESNTHSTKKEFSRAVEFNGKCIHVALNKDTMYLVTNDTSSKTTKMQKAEKNGTKIVTYQEFYDMIQSLG